MNPVTSPPEIRALIQSSKTVQPTPSVKHGSSACNGVNKKKIVVIGAGFGGATAAVSLSKMIGRLKSGYEILLVDKHSHQLYTPALYEISSMPSHLADDADLETSVLIPLKLIIEKRAINFINDELVGLDSAGRIIFLKKRGGLEYEYLILALGSQTNYFNIPGLKEYGFPLKTFDDGVRIRNKIEATVLKKGEIRIFVAGAGSAGVEVVAEFMSLICSVRERLTGKKICDADFTLVEASPEILQGFSPDTIKMVENRLRELGVNVKTDAAITAVTEKEIIYKNGESDFYDILVWTGGVKGLDLFKEINLPLSQKGALDVDEFLRIRGDERIFAIGDNALIINPRTLKAVVWNVPAAQSQGRVAAKNIIRCLKNLALCGYIPPKKYPFVLPVGKKYAIADLVFIKISGYWGWIIKQAIGLRYLLFILSPGKALKIWLIGLKYFSANDKTS